MSTILVFNQEYVFDVKTRVDQNMLSLFASIVSVLLVKKQDSGLVRFRTNGGDLEHASKIINLLEDVPVVVDFLVEKEVSSAGILILPSAGVVSAKRCARFQWHHQVPKNCIMSMSEIQKADWTKAEYIASKTGLSPDTYFKLMDEGRLVLADEMVKLGLVHEIIPC